MKEFPVKDTGVKLNQRVSAIVSFKVCPFCGEVLEKLDEWNNLRFVKHRPTECNRAITDHCDYFMDEDNHAIYILKDADGDWWAFWPNDNFDSVDYYLRPTTQEELAEALSESLNDQRATLARSERIWTMID